jgi:hypothetical protein
MAVSERVRRHRASLRARGLRPIQIWVPDTRSPGFADECRRQSEALIGDSLETETLAFIESISETTGWRE